MIIQVSPSQDIVNTALVTFLAGVLSATDVIAGQVNRVPEPVNPDFVVFWPIRRPRLSTNLETALDCRFTGSLTATALTVTAVQHGKIIIGNSLFGVNVAAGSSIQSQSSGTPGGIGTYVIAPSQTLASQTLASGAMQLMQATEAVYQIDVHGPHSADNSQIITTIMRSEFGVKEISASGVTPLFADEPRQVPFLNAEQQYEDRWEVDLHFQINPALLVPQEFADQVKVARVPVDAFYQG